MQSKCGLGELNQVSFFFLVPALLRDCSLRWEHLEVVQTPHTCQALTCGYNTRQIDTILFSYILVQYLNGPSST